LEYADERRRLYQLAVLQGLDETYDFTQLTGVPSYLVKKWMGRFFVAPGAIEFPKVPRLVNRFALGADPEFAFIGENKVYCHAEKLGMNTILPFGCDMAGRQAELRAHSSRFALEVVASLVDALRWIPSFYNTSRLQWIAPAFIDRDGCGGHIHFGRKRPTRDAEVDILDSVLRLLKNTGVFDANGTSLRIQNTRFGQNGDIRLQPHGYEYRAFPTWLSSPQVAYLTLVISKLALHFGTPIPYVRGKEKIQLINLLRLYRHLDDDAAIALRMWSLYGIPQYDATCFKERWGVFDNPFILVNKNIQDYYFPLSLRPEEATVRELLYLFLIGTPLKLREPQAAWKPFKLGQNFKLVTVRPHIMELPNIAQGLVSKNYSVNLQQAGDDRITVYASGNVLDENKIRNAVKKLRPDVGFIHTKGEISIRIYVPRVILQNQVQVEEFRDIISDTSLFPISKGENIDKVDWRHWDNPVKPPAEKLYGKILLEQKGQRVREQNEWVPIKPPELRKLKVNPYGEEF
jgi:hypothetical protein